MDKPITYFQKYRTQLSVLLVIAAILAAGSWLVGWWQSEWARSSNRIPPGFTSPTLPPPQLTPEEKAQIQASINAPAPSATSTVQAPTPQQMQNILQSLTAPTK
ncbi:hypothetical protein KGO95_01395 [Patescibacteria group bacterium]|nr:hypothetical protein [Patescibacteria group bacterium]